MTILIISLQYIAAFAVATLASNSERVNKPFNPLLGETYELNLYVHCYYKDIRLASVCQQSVIACSCTKQR